MNDTAEATSQATAIAPEDRKRAEQHLRYWTKEPASEPGVRVAVLLDRWEGLHHFDSAQMRRVEWSNPRFQVLKLSKYMSPGGGLATWDFDCLTRLVFLAHDLCIRVDITPCNAEYLAIAFHPRAGREGSMPARHPTLESAVAAWRKSNPLEVPCKP